MPGTVLGVAHGVMTKMEVAFAILGLLLQRGAGQIPNKQTDKVTVNVSF